MNPKNIVGRLMLPLLIILSAISFLYVFKDPGTTTLIYSDLLKEIDKATIKKITIYPDGAVEGEFTASKDGGKTRFESSIGEGDSAFLSRKLESQNPVPEIIKRNRVPSFLEMVLNLLPIILIVGFVLYIISRVNSVNSGGGNSSIGNIGGFMRARIKERDKSKPVTFRDVAGCDEAKEELSEIVDFLGYPYKYTKLGGRIPKGVLLVGPPGVGKTLLARAVAGEANVPFFSMAGSEFVEKFVGVGASRVRELFDKARANPPCIIFIDEVDALGKRGSGNTITGHNELEQTLNQVLVEMDGFESTKGIIVIAATNREDKLDEALLRPGRFDRKVSVHLPDIKGREEVLAIHVRGVALSPQIDMKVLARMTPGYSGADLANLVNEAALNAAKESKESVSMKDFEFAREKILMGRENKSLSSVMTEAEKKITAVHEAGHALVAVMMPGNDPLYKVSIIPRGRALGITSQLPEKDRYNVSQEYLMENLSILFGGRVAEKKVFDRITAGAQNDIERASELARTMVCELGMSELGPVNFNQKNDSPWSNQSEQTQREIDMEVRKILDKAYQDAETVINKHSGKLEKIANALMEKETLEREEIEKIVKES